MSRRKRTKKQARNNRLRLLAILLAAVGVILSLFVFFKINTVEVRGTSRYTDEEIRAAVGLSAGDSLLRFVSSSRERLAEQKLPYLESVNLKRALPDRLIIEVTQVAHTAVVDCGGSYAVVSYAGKLLEYTAHRPAGTLLLGVPALTEEQPGSLLTKGTELENALAVAAAFEEAGLGDALLLVDAADLLELKAVYDGRVLVTIGTVSNLDYKLDMLKEIVLNREAKSFCGVIDLSIAGKGTVRDDADALATYSDWIL